MPFISGTTLGSYEVTANIGEGGIVSVAGNVSLWPFFTVKEVLNVVESNFRFVPESGRSEYTFGGRSECLLMAESRHWVAAEPP